MFKIKAIQSIEEQIQFANACGTTAISGYFAYAMQDVETNETMGFSQFDITGEIAYISDIKEAIGRNDFEAMFILGRSTMNFIDMCGAHSLSAKADAGDNILLRAIGLKKTENGELYCDMTGFFDGSHCS